MGLHFEKLVSENRWTPEKSVFFFGEKTSFFFFFFFGKREHDLKISQVQICRYVQFCCFVSAKKPCDIF